MKLTGRKLSALLWLGCFAMICSAFASAQISSSVGDSLALPLDNDLNGLDSAVAPAPLTEIAPGATSLMTPDEHQLPFDAIGASIVATPLNPSVTQLFVVSRVPFQLDSAVKDSTILTGQHTKLPIEILENAPRKTGNMDLMSVLPKLPASSFGRPLPSLPSPTASPSLVPPDKTASGTNVVLLQPVYPQSSWRAGSGNTAAELEVNPPQTGSMPLSDHALNSDGKNNSLLLDKKQKKHSEAYASSTQLTEQPRDYSRSPLDAVTATGLDSATVTPGPFESLDQTSFLNPDITLATLHQNSTKGTRASFNTQTQSAFSRQTQSSLARKQSDLPASRRDSLSVSTTSTRKSGITRANARLMKESSTEQQVKRPKWHNPILQQMDDEAAISNRNR